MGWNHLLNIGNYYRLSNDVMKRMNISPVEKINGHDEIWSFVILDRHKEIQENINTDYIYVSSSNEIETPNDHVLFSTNENNTIKFRNIKNNDEKTISLVDFVRSLPALKEKRDIPIISEEIFQAVYSGIYKDEDINFFERLSNPSSGGLATSNMSSSRSALF